ncbi:hypothetical protein ACGRHY_28885 [Streptomyces sp. HK10]|uniref:hypothetical protein n=1 Tax=Streptomyces sp. HK10 TaxID=3373255 RepID=UPI00374969E3
MRNILKPGTPALHHGSLVKYHGLRVALLCGCSHCFQRVLAGLPAVRYDLRPADGRYPRTGFPEHAFPASIPPAVSR